MVARVTALVVGGIMALLSGLSMLFAIDAAFFEDDPLTADGAPFWLVLALLLALIATLLIRIGAHGVLGRRRSQAQATDQDFSARSRSRR